MITKADTELQERLDIVADAQCGHGEILLYEEPRRQCLMGPGGANRVYPFQPRLDPNDSTASKILSNLQKPGSKV